MSDMTANQLSTIFIDWSMGFATRDRRDIQNRSSHNLGKLGRADPTGGCVLRPPLFQSSRLIHELGRIALKGSRPPRIIVLPRYIRQTLAAPFALIPLKCHHYTLFDTLRSFVMHRRDLGYPLGQVLEFGRLLE